MPKEIKLFNTLSKEIELLEPLSKQELKIYCCGPTVYNYQHIGNLRTYVFEDLLVRALRLAGYNVKHVMNITDVGHLVSDADEGEDKMAVAMKREKKKSHEIAEFYTEIFFKHCAELNICKPDIICKATEHIEDMIALIKRIEANGCTYESNGNIYFDISKLPDYGKLAQLDLKKLQAGARIEVDPNKRNPHDFVLWFTKSKFENQELQWDSPWGRGYPGWHIECSAMSIKYLGDEFDIHCGGIDHIPVHHTNEIAQSEAATQKPWVKIWMHGEFLVLNKQKMAKSAGGFITLDTISEKGIDPLAYRMMCLGAHYRQQLTFSWESLEQSAASLKKLKSQVLSLKSEAGGNHSNIESEQAQKYISEFEAAFFNDLNAPNALAVLWSALGDNSIEAPEKLNLLYQMDQIFGFNMENFEEEIVDVPAEVQALVEKRVAARNQKNWEESDRLRDEIKALGYQIEDSAEGIKVKPI